MKLIALALLLSSLGYARSGPGTLLYGHAGRGVVPVYSGHVPPAPKTCCTLTFHIFKPAPMPKVTPVKLPHYTAPRSTFILPKFHPGKPTSLSQYERMLLRH